MRLALPLLAVCLAVAGCSSAGATSGSEPVGLKTLPGVEPPHITVTHPADNTASGLVFVAQKGATNGLGGPVIADNQGRILWYHQLPPGLQATDFRTQTYHGKPVLTWWQGIISKAGVGRGVYEIYDSSYREIAEIAAGDGLVGDLHEFQLTPRGTAFITVYNEEPADLRSVGGPKDGYVLDSVAQEIDVATGKLLFEWHSIGHVPFSDSREAHREPAEDATEARPLDYFHINSISDGPNGTILISARNTSTIYLLARDGHIIWRIGTAGSDFGPPAAVKMRYQHDARLHPGNLLSFFDNGGVPREEPYSSPTVLKLDPATKRATVVKRLLPPKQIASPYEGDIQLLPDGGAFVGWGGVRKVTEFDPAGNVRFELELPFGDTYRGFRLHWHGDPGGRPTIALQGGSVYASWNGKLGIARWQVLAGPDPAHLSVSGGAAWRGLETALRIPDGARAVAVRAVGASGGTLGTSATILR